MRPPKTSIARLRKLIEQGTKLPLATKNYPSRGQTAVQDLYQTPKGKLFLKRSSKQNHIDCQIKLESGTLAEREFWAFRLAHHLALNVPTLWLLDRFTTLQTWLDLPDARQFATTQGKLDLDAEDVFNCALFDWLTGQVDRHDANYLYDYARRRVVLVDSAHCFLKYSGSIPDYLRYFEIGFPKELRIVRQTPVLREIISLSTKKLSMLVPLRNEEENKALADRLAQIQLVKRLQEIISLYRGGRP